MNFSASVFLALLLLSFTGLSHSADTLKSTEAELKAVSQDIHQLKGRLKTLNKERSSTENQLLRIEKEIQQLQGDIRQVESLANEKEQEINQLKARQKALIVKRDKEKERIAISLNSLYKTGSDSRIKLLLNQEDPNEVARQLVYLDYFQKAQIDAINTFESVIRDLEKNKTLQFQANQQLLDKRDSLKEKNALLKEENRNRQKLISQLSSQFQKSDKQLNQLEKQRKELEVILASLKSRAVHTQVPFNKMRGKLPWPVNGKLLFSYNERRPDTHMRWQGLFISANNNQATAVHDGKVIFADWLRGYGLLVIVDHGQDYLTLYAHNQSLLKKEGDNVLAGEPLSVIGQTGGQVSPGLYFELRHKGKPQNPSAWLVRR
ncbi:peptidoglycan DD-metalloendopeptidase family protein [Endozoicomonas sp. Mp262]|uniref:murein hydrolase activator EnvC family protein n=1 Tax=Endozoicomonas sp. Mp262 TaxID=2919499 RepID=UPI0021D9C1D5